MVKIAITCTRPRCDTIVAKLKAQGIDAIAIPALEVAPVTTPCPDGDFEAILFTSPHAVTSCAARHTHLPAIAIGTHTAAIATDNGYNVVQVGDTNLKAMDLSKYQSILYPCAAEPSLIPDNSAPWVVYQTTENDHFAIPSDINIVAVLSAKSARIINTIKPAHAKIICLSQFIADQMTAFPTDRLAVCPQPDYDGLEKIIIRMCE